MNTGADKEIERLVRHYLGTLLRRSLPIASVVVLLVTVLALRSPEDSASTSVATGTQPSSSGSSSSGTSGPTEGSPGTGLSSGSPTGSPVGGASRGAGAGAPGPSGAPNAPNPNAAPSASSPSSSGVARSGVNCGPGIRQVPWSKYAPMCTPRFEAGNGGATGQGVTAETITLSYRRQNSGQAQAIQAIAGEATPSDAQYEHDLNVFIALFNRTYELYGRKVQLKAFNGKGDYLLEDLGQGQQAAAADGITARELGAFADVTFPSAGSLFFAQALQSQGVIGYNFPLNPQDWYEKNSPYQYNTFLSGLNWEKWVSNLACQRMKGMPAVFAGDPELQGKERVFGLVGVEFPTWLQVANSIADRLSAQCGIQLAKRATYAENVGTLQQDASSIVAQMKSAGVTTVICFCDPLMPIFISNAATAQAYRPEWIFQNDFDPIQQVTDQEQMSHAMAPGPALLPPSQSEAYAAYKLADPKGEPASPYYQAAYEVMLHLFSALQIAGPNLNPETYRNGVFAMPPSLPGGEFGEWEGGPGRHTPINSIGVVFWDTKNKSGNGKLGTWRSCEGGKLFSFEDAPSWGSGQIGCFR